MRVKAAIMKIVAPELQNHGFVFSGNPGPSYSFVTKDKSMIVSFDLEKFYPQKLRTVYWFRCNEPVLQPPPSLQLNYFRPSFCPASAISYQTQEEFNYYLTVLAKDTLDIIVPYIDAMKKNYISSSYDMRKKLATEPRQRAERFSEKYKMLIEPLNQNMRQMDSILDDMKKDIFCRKLEFFDHEDDIIDMAAYFGELICKREGTPSLWEWRNVSGTTQLFGAGKTRYDPLRRVLMAWNFGSETTNYSMQSYYIE